MKISDLININGQWFPITRDMTPEEEAEAERRQAEEEAQRRQQEPTDMDKLESQLTYTAMMTDTLIEED